MTNAVAAVLLLLFLWPGDGQPTTEKAKVAITMTGTVRDPAGAPIAKATVWLPTCYSVIRPEVDRERGNGGAVTDTTGRYSFTAGLRGSDFAELFERGVSVQADGFVRAELPFKAEHALKAGDMLAFDVELKRGEPLAGTIDVPLRLSERMNGVKEDERRYLVRVTGKSFVQYHHGAREFEIWVPKGALDIDIVHDGQQARFDAPSASLKEVTGGTRGLKLAKIEPVIEPETLTQAFDALWEDMFWYYSYFELKRVDWPALKSKYRRRAVASRSLAGFVDVLGEMLGELNDGHVWFLEPTDAVVAYPPERIVVDTNLAATEATIEGLAEIGNGFAQIGTTREGGFGVVRITRMSRADDAAVDEVIKFIKTHAGAPGFVVDLRGADGGSELVARRIARQFCAKQRIYARSKYRGGADPGDFGPTYDRTLDASDTPYTKPVVCVLGPGCVSSGEAFAMMMQCLPNVTTVGRASRGSSGNPRPCTLPGVPVTVLFSRWVDMLPDGRPIEGRGIAPSVAVELSEEEYEKADPTWQKALVVLRDKVEEATDSKKVTP